MISRAVVVKSAGKAAVVPSSIPKLRDDCITVRVKAVALNPTDTLHIDIFAPVGARVGCDYAGTVEEIGPIVHKKFKKGDRVAGFVHGANAVQHEDGAFAEYIVPKGDVQIRIPDNMGFEEAARLGLGVTTAGQALYQALGISFPSSYPSLIMQEVPTVIILVSPVISSWPSHISASPSLTAKGHL